MTTVYLSTAAVVSDFSVSVDDGAVHPALDDDALLRLDKRFRSRRPAMVCSAIELWLAQAKPVEIPEPERRAIVLGTETGAGADIERFLSESIKRGDAVVNPGLFPWTVHNAASGVAAIIGSCRGPNIVTSSGVQTGRSAFQTAVAQLKAGSADFVYCGVYESMGDAFGTIATITALATRPEMLGGRCLGPLGEMHIDIEEEVSSPQSVLRWSKNFSQSAVKVALGAR
ncbi:MAG: beta-ketoacyl synthase N-terminal-like domain-containing protein [Myxococcota bacterium]